MNAEKILNEINRTSVQLLLKEPFFGIVFSGINKILSSEIPTISIIPSGKTGFQLAFNPDYWATYLTVQENDEQTRLLRLAIIKHQLLHIMFKHFLYRKNYNNKLIFNVAADVFANEHIPPPQKRAEVLDLRALRKISILRSENFGDYYNQLKSKRELITVLSPIQTAHLAEHDTWEGFEELSRAEQRIIENQIDKLLLNARQQMEKFRTSGAVFPYAVSTLFSQLPAAKRGSMHWTRLLRLFIGSSRRTFLKNTIRKPSKRYGTSPGIKIKNQKKLLIALDTSGSVSSSEISQFFAEIFLIWKRGAQILIQEADNKIRRQYLYAGTQPERVRGRGETDFNAPIRYANESFKPDGIIYFTDGIASAPKVISRCPVLWVITKNGIDKGGDHWHQLPYHKIKISS